MRWYFSVENTTPSATEVVFWIMVLFVPTVVAFHEAGIIVEDDASQVENHYEW
jgi:hypothetical protein